MKIKINLQSMLLLIGISTNAYGGLMNKEDCHIMYDAGSSGTRLYIYERQGDSWIQHKGPETSALADPVRRNRGKSAEDIDPVTTEIVDSLDGISKDGPMKRGKPKWKAFDWKNRCNVRSATVFATAGMRLAEQENSADSIVLWKKLSNKLQAKVGTSVPVVTRTMTGYEEGLYAWLSVRAYREDNAFGIAEMGGVSAQIAFPCDSCNTEDPAVMTIMVAGKPVKMYSYSFLGLGQDEAPKILGMAPSCYYGAGTIDEQWDVKACSSRIFLRDRNDGIFDPYDFDVDRGTQADVPTRNANATEWLLTGAYRYRKPSDIDNCCRTKGSCYEPVTSCFRPIFLNKFLKILGVPDNAKKSNAQWPLGAVICAETQCLPAPEVDSAVCNWLPRQKGCL